MNRALWGRAALVVALVMALASPSIAFGQPVRSKRSGHIPPLGSGPFGLGGFNALSIDANNNIGTAVPLPASPLNGTISQIDDEDDVFTVSLTKGQKFVAAISGPVDTDFDLFIWAPGTKSVKVADKELPCRPAADGVSYPDQVAFTAPVTGTYYVDIWAAWGEGRYTVSWYKTTGEADDTLGSTVVATRPGHAGSFSASDMSDIYAVDLTAGQWLAAELLGPAGTDFDLYLYHPTAERNDGSDASRTVGAAISTKYPDNLSFEATMTGTYRLEVISEAGLGTYTLGTSIAGKATSVVFAPTSPIPYLGTATLAGQVQERGNPANLLAGRRVKLMARTYKQSVPVKIAEAITDAQGGFSFSHKPAVSTVYYVRAVDADPDYTAANSPQREVRPKAYLTRPSIPASTRSTRSFTASGILKPRQAVGGRNVSVVCQRWEGGKWVERSRAVAVNRGTDPQKYYASLRLPKGRWRLYSVATSPSFARTASGTSFISVY